MPITIIEVQDHSVGLLRAHHHDCSLGEFQHQLVSKIQAIFIARAKEKKERVNWHDLFEAAFTEMEEAGIIKSSAPWQKIGDHTLFSRRFIQAVQNYNFDPKSFNLTKMVPEKPDEPENK